MEIDIYSKYYVLVETEFTYVDAETSEPNDWNYVTDSGRYDFYCNCKELIDFLFKKINDEFFSDLRIKENQDLIIINTFNPNTGEGDKIKIYIERVGMYGTDDFEN